MKPMLWQKTQSTLQWPQQNRPPAHELEKWQKWLRSITKANTLTLRKRLREYLPATTNHRKWTSTFYEPLQHKDRDNPTHSLTVRTKWTHQTFAKLEQATRIDIFVTSTNNYEHQMFRWTLAADDNLIMDGSARRPPQIYAAKTQGILCGIIDSLKTVNNEYYRRNAPKPILIINIWRIR